jgi:hypothetical protein
MELEMNMLMKMKEILKDNTVDKGAGKRYYHGNIITFPMEKPLKMLYAVFN